MKTKIILFDIETAPNLAYVWGKYEQNVLAYKTEGYLLCFSYKVLGEKKIYSYSLPDFKSYSKDKINDKELVTKLWEILNDADIVVAHNGDQFDCKLANSYFVRHGLKPTTPYKTIDTCRVAKTHFKFNSNSLNDLSKYLGLGEKIRTGGFDLWLDCIAGEKSAWRRMISYNKQDVALLEKLYLKLLPWMTGHPNINILTGDVMNCPNCGSDKLHKRGYGINLISKYIRYQCQNCGRWAKGKLEKSNLGIK